jgi:hypothetical protein
LPPIIRVGGGLAFGGEQAYAATKGFLDFAVAQRHSELCPLGFGRGDLFFDLVAPHSVCGIFDRLVESRGGGYKSWGEVSARIVQLSRLKVKQEVV